MIKQEISGKIRSFLFDNKVAILFTIVVILAFQNSGVSTVMFFSELATRFGRNTFIVLSLLIPVVAGLGLNFGIVLGAMAAQIAIFFVVLLGVPGVYGIFLAALIATPIGIVFGYLVGKLFNKMKGTEMIGGLVTGLFADGFYQFFFLFILGGVIPIATARVMTSTGIGVLNAIDLNVSPSYMRQALDNVSMTTLLNVAFFATLAFIIGLIIFKLVKKQAIHMLGQGGVIKPIVVFVLLGIAYAISFINLDFSEYLDQNRMGGITAVNVVFIGMLLSMAYRIIKEKCIDKKPGVPVGSIINVVFIVLAYLLLTLQTDIYTGLSRVRVPVFTYMIIAGLCFFVKWFLNTRLGQNMRTVGQSRPVATAAGINVDKTRITAMIFSTVLASYGQIIALQNFGVMQTYGSHTQVGLYAIAALLVGGATVSRASVKHALLGVLLFHALFILAPLAANELLGNALIGEYARVVVANGVIALALIMHAWTKIKKKKEKESDKEEPKAEAATA